MAGKVYIAIPVETNRGCPFKCTYCNSPSQVDLYKDNNCGHFFRKKKIDRVLAELEALRNQWKAEYVYFPSDTFLIMKDDEFNQFVEGYQDTNLPYWIQTRPRDCDFRENEGFKQCWLS